MSRPLKALFVPSRPVSAERFSRRLSIVLSVFVLLGLVLLVPVSQARARSAMLRPGVVPAMKVVRPAHGKRYELRLYHLHTGEHVDVVYRIGNRYIPSALAKLNYLLRDDRTQAVKHYDPQEFDLLHNLLVKLGRPHAQVDVVCGYRTPWTNHYLRTRGPDTGVAAHSQHMLAKAIDIRVPGVSTRRLDRAALSLRAGGVGYYPVSHFVHVDVGPVRHWSFRG